MSRFTSRPSRISEPARHVLDVIVGTKQDDNLVGTDGDDTLDGRKGRDTMAGGLGHDLYIVDDAGDVVVEGADAGEDTVRASVSYALADAVENLVLTGKAGLTGSGNTLANKITGNKGDNWLDGDAGDDTLIGGAGRDTLAGGLGVDRLEGGAGDDLYLVDDSRDKVKEGTNGGNDTVNSLVTWTLGDGLENLELANHFDRIDGYGNALGNAITGSAASNLIDGGEGDDTIAGGSWISPFVSDTLIGGAGNDDITGSSPMGSDELYGGLGDDTLRSISGVLYGDDGNDLLQGGVPQGHHAVGNALYGGTGQDTLLGGGALLGGEGDDLLQTQTGHYADGGAGNDTITGSGANGFTDYDVFGGEGDDVVDVFATNGMLSVAGGDGNDHIQASALRDVTVRGGSGDDVITASSFTDGTVVVEAGDGDDTLVVGSGVQQLSGGSGADRFVLTTAEQAMKPILVNDYELGLDRLLISQASLPVGNGDLTVDGAAIVNGPGGFHAGSELVLLAQDIVGPVTLDAIAAAFGSADEAYTAGQTSVFVAGNGTETWLVYFESSGDDAGISAAELSIIGRLGGGMSLPPPEEIGWTA